MNLYCYCMNNPIMFIDNDGLMPAVIFAIAVLMVAITFGILVVDSKAEKKEQPLKNLNFFQRLKTNLLYFQ